MFRLTGARGVEASGQAGARKTKMSQGRRLQSETTAQYKANTPGYRAQQTQHRHGTERVKRPGSGDAPSWKREMC